MKISSFILFLTFLVVTTTAQAQCVPGEIRVSEIPMTGLTVPKFCDGTIWWPMNFITPTADTCAEAGSFTRSGNQMRFCDGSLWRSLAPASLSLGSCSENGRFSYDNDSKVMSVCSLGENRSVKVPPLAQTFSVPWVGSTYTVPLGVYRLFVKAWGAGGGGGGGATAPALAGLGAPYSAARGGAGAFMLVQIDVTPGEILTVNIGAGGDGGISTSINLLGALLAGRTSSGGGGGGLTSIQRANGDLIFAVGAGGGGGGADNKGDDLSGAGGAGGIENGEQGENSRGTISITGGRGASQIAGGGGGGGYPSSGGMAASPGADWSSPSSGGVGGASTNGSAVGASGGAPRGGASGKTAGSYIPSGAGGGAGFFGGGGGGGAVTKDTEGTAGGGGGSSYVVPDQGFLLRGEAGSRHTPGGLSESEINLFTSHARGGTAGNGNSGGGSGGGALIVIYPEPRP